MQAMNHQDINFAVDREIARQHLELANMHVAEGRRRVDAQMALMARIARDGHDTLEARKLLEQFEQTLALQMKTREIVQQLADSR